jgi:hypothetical protein
MSQQIGSIATLADFVAMSLPTRRESALTYQQLAHKVYGDPVHPVTSNEKRSQRTHVRQLYEIVQQLRLAGVPVCSSDSGLWRAVLAQDAMDAYEALRRRYITQALTARALRRAARRMAAAERQVEQTELWAAA